MIVAGEHVGIFIEEMDMLKNALAVLLIAPTLTGLAVAGETDQSEPPMMGIHWTHDAQDAHDTQNAKAARTGSSPLMTYHGAKILATANTQVILWGPSWANSSFVGDKITGLDTWYNGFSLSDYAKASDEYTQSDGTHVGSSSSYLGHIVDTSTATGGSKTSAILAEVCKVVSPDTTGNGYYAVYTDVKRGHASYCAWHSTGSCGGVPVQFAFFFDLDGDAGCDPADTSGLHSQGLAALANVSGHEFSEARTDPSLAAWYDSSGSENGDKCAWTFGAPLVTFTNGSQWKIQGEWSNAAYTAGTGYPNSSGQKGCLSGL
jgi:hypothetical protein